MSEFTTRDIYQTVTDAIVAAIETGAASGSWRMPWNAAASGDTAMPSNAVSRKAYRGINVVALWAAAARAGYPTGIWATYKQWGELGAQVRKGERGSSIVFWKQLTSRDTAGDGDEGEGRTRTRMMARGYTVFNAAQVDGWTPPTVASPGQSEAARIAGADAYFVALGGDVRHGGNRAFYQPGNDYIQMPEFAAFRDPIAYYSTLAHEYVHWTGIKGRSERDLSGRFGDEAYAAEELVAELGAAFQMAGLGLSAEPRLDHARYVASWLRVLKGDKRAIFTASAKAQAAVDWLEARAASHEAAQAA